MYSSPPDCWLSLIVRSVCCEPLWYTIYCWCFDEILYIIRRIGMPTKYANHKGITDKRNVGFVDEIWLRMRSILSDLKISIFMQFALRRVVSFLPCAWIRNERIRQTDPDKQMQICTHFLTSLLDMSFSICITQILLLL